MSAMLRRLAGQTAVYGVSTIVERLLSFLMTPYLTYLAMTDGVEYGMVTYLYALIPILLVVLTMGLETSYFRFADRADEFGGKQRLFGSLLSLTTLAALAFLALVFVFTPVLAGALKFGGNPWYIRLVAVIVSLDVISAVPFAKLRQEGRPGRFMAVKLTTVVVNITLMVVMLSVLPWLQSRFGGVWDSLWFPQFKVGYYLVANVLASSVKMLMLAPALHGIRPSLDRKILRPVLIYSMPLLVSGIAGSANEYIDRQMLNYLIPSPEAAMETIGILGAAAKVGTVMYLFTQIYRMGAEPFFLSNFKKEDFCNLTAEAMKYFIIVSLGIFLMIGLFTDVFSLIVGPNYRSGMDMLPVILLSNMLSGVVLNLSFWYKQTGATRYAIYVTVTGLVFTVVFNILLVPVLGIWGAVLARLVCESAMVALSYALNRKHYPIPYDLRRIGEYVLLAAAIYCTVFVTGGWAELLRYCVNLLLLAAFALYAVRREKIDVGSLVKSLIKR